MSECYHIQVGKVKIFGLPVGLLNDPATLLLPQSLITAVIITTIPQFIIPSHDPFTMEW